MKHFMPHLQEEKRKKKIVFSIQLHEDFIRLGNRRTLYISATDGKHYFFLASPIILSYQNESAHE